MKRMLHYKATDDGFAFFENEKNVFEIKRASLQFDVKAFYYAFYGNENDYGDIEIVNEIGNDKEGKRVFDCVSMLMEKIAQKMDELPETEEE